MRISDWSSDVCSSDLVSRDRVARDLGFAATGFFRGGGQLRFILARKPDIENRHSHLPMTSRPCVRQIWKPCKFVLRHLRIGIRCTEGAKMLLRILPGASPNCSQIDHIESKTASELVCNQVTTAQLVCRLLLENKDSNTQRAKITTNT